MKLELLVVLVVLAVVPSLSQGRLVSECELRDKLTAAITLPPRLQGYRENIVATVICELKRRSSLNSNLVTVQGKRRTTTTATPTTTTRTTTPEPTTTETTTPEPTTTETTTPEPTTPEPTTTETTTTETTTLEPTTTETTTLEPTTTETTTTETTTLEPTTTETTTLEPTTTETTTTETTTLETTTPEPTTTETTTLEPTTTETTTPGPIIPFRRKRAVQSKRELNSLDKRLKELLRDERLSLFDEEEFEQDNKMKDDGEDRDEKDKKGHGKRTKRDKKQPSPSLGFYGLFQLSDGYFCDSGYRQSRNVCRKDCTAFIDDDIMDDITCVVNTNYWWYLLIKAPGSCFNTWSFVQTCS